MAEVRGGSVHQSDMMRHNAMTCESMGGAWIPGMGDGVEKTIIGPFF